MTQKHRSRMLAGVRVLALLGGTIVCALEDTRTFAQQTDAKRQVGAAIQEAIRLLEAKKHLEFVKTFMRPNELDELITKFGTVEKLATEFGKDDERSGNLLKALHAAAKLEPTFNADGTIARYAFEAPVGRERSLSLQKIGDRWYLRD